MWISKDLYFGTATLSATFIVSWEFIGRQGINNCDICSKVSKPSLDVFSTKVLSGWIETTTPVTVTHVCSPHFRCVATVRPAGGDSVVNGGSGSRGVNDAERWMDDYRANGLFYARLNHVWKECAVRNIQHCGSLRGISYCPRAERPCDFRTSAITVRPFRNEPNPPLPIPGRLHLRLTLLRPCSV